MDYFDNIQIPRYHAQIGFGNHLLKMESYNRIMRCLPITIFVSVKKSEPDFLIASIRIREPSADMAWVMGLIMFVSSRRS